MVKFASASETEFPRQLKLLQRMRPNRLHIIPVVGIRDCCIETVVIECVEEFAAKLESGAIADLDLLDRGKIPLARTGIYNRHCGPGCKCSRTIPHSADDRASQFLALLENGEHLNRGAGAPTWSLSADILKPPKRVLSCGLLFTFLSLVRRPRRTEDRTGVGKGPDKGLACIPTASNLGSFNPYVQPASWTIKDRITRGNFCAQSESTCVP
jgi:hypothetical protein